jgi:hypothetical protein
MTNRHIFMLVTTAIAVACAAAPAVGQQQQPTRSRDTRGNDERGAQFRCLNEAKVAYAGYAGPQAAREAGESAFMMSCVINAMPDDWSAAARYRKRAQTYAETAQASDPKIDPCLLTACTTVPPK